MTNTGLVIRPYLVVPETIADIIKDALDKDKDIYRASFDVKKDIIKDRCYIQDGLLTIKVTTSYKGIIHEYYTYKDGREIIEGVPEGGACYAVCARHYWKAEERNKQYDLSASPLLGYNHTYNKTRQWAISYDLNSAYTRCILQGWIDTTPGPQAKIVEEDEIGFDATLSDLVDEGEFSLFVFKKCPPPEGLVKFCLKYYEQKKNPKTKKEKITAKNMLNHVVGCLQNKDPFLRAYVVASCNRFISDLLDEDTLYYNTDCIVSRVRRPDLEENIGLDVGQWKIDHEGMFAYDGFTYQWDFEKPAWRSVPKEWIPEHYDILNCDDIQIVETNLWFMDWDKIQFKMKEGLQS
jgi:hypothetical protein